MSSSDRELEEQLSEAGNRLLDPPPTADELLPLLEQVENVLLRVEQSPSESMQTALSPSLKALVADQLFRHSNIDVKVSVASCISEITRITAPDAPYDDDQMKEVFQLIVSSFENLSDKSSPSYAKRVSILETVAKVRSCVVMLDLECNSLIIEMFKHFLKYIRDDHPENVFSSMERIMTLVIEESEDISIELLSAILASVKKGNEEVLPVACKLGEKVLENCAPKLKPYLKEAVKALGSSLDAYGSVVVSICQEASTSIEQNDLSGDDDNADESKSVRTSADEAAQVVGEPSGVGLSECGDPTLGTSLKSATGNGTAQIGEDCALADLKTVKRKGEGNQTNQLKCVKTPRKSGNGNLDSKEAASNEKMSESITKKRGRVNDDKMTEPTTKKKGRKSKMLLGTSKSSDHLHVDNEEESENLPDHKTHGEDASTSHCDALPAENEKESCDKPSSPKELENEKDIDVKTDIKLSKRSGKKARGEISTDHKTAAAESEFGKDGETESDSEEIFLKLSAKRVDGNSKNDGRSSSKQLEDKKRRARGKAISGRDPQKPSSKDDEKEKFSSPKLASKSTKDNEVDETPKTISKRKRTSGKEQESGTEDPGESLVGSRIKVWWPMDKRFYEGLIDSFHPDTMKHRVLYDDGDEELLNLGDERWEFVEGCDSGSGQGKAKDPSPASNDMTTKKKTKLNSEESIKPGNRISSAKKGGETSSSKSKGSATNSDKNSKDEDKVENKSKNNFSKSTGKSVNDSSSKSKDSLSRMGRNKAADVASKKTSKLKNDEDDDSDTPKTSKLKDEDSDTPKTGKSKDSDMAKTGKSKDYDMPKTSKLKDEDFDMPKSSKSKDADTPKTGKSKDSDMPKSGRSKDSDMPKTGRSKDSYMPKAGKSKESDMPKTGKSKDSDMPKTGKSNDSDMPKTGRSNDSDTPKTSKTKDSDMPTKTGKLKEADTLKASKSKQDTPKAGKSKQETPKTVSISKGKTSKSGGKAIVNGSGKVKSGAPKIKESENEKENSSDSEVPESTKGKSPNSAKAHGSKTKSGKKRTRR